MKLFLCSVSLLVLCAILPRAFGQNQRPSETLTATSRPQDLVNEWWLNLRNGTVVIADRSAIRFDSSMLVINGTLRDMTIPTRDIKSITRMPNRVEFRNAALGTLFLSSMLFLSPTETPGYYPGRMVSSSSYSSSQQDFPGISLTSVVLAAGAAVAAGFVAQSIESRPYIMPLDGTESVAAWKLILEDDSPRWHLRGSTVLQLSSIHDDWRRHHTRFGFDEQTVSRSPYATDRLDMYDINLGRMLHLSYTILPQVEFGIAIQSDGVNRFYEETSFFRPGNPPQQVYQEVSNQLGWNSVLATGQYISYASPRVSAGVGGGVGSTGITVRISGYDRTSSGFQTNSAASTIVDKRAISLMIFGSVNYHLDRTLSFGLHADYTHIPKLRIPEQTLKDWDGRIYRIIDPFELALGSASLGLVLGFHF